MKVVPQYRADRPIATPVPSHADDSGAVLDEKSRKFLPTALMCGIESEMLLVETEGRLQLSRGTVSAGALLEKQWTLLNLGKVAWPKRAKLVCIGGDKAGLDVVTDESDLEIPGWVGPGSKVEVKVQLRAPSLPGAYVVYFRLQDTGGRLFGQRLWAQATVSAGDIDTSIVDVVARNDAGRLRTLVDADRKRKGSADAAHRRADMRPISHPAAFSLGLWEQAQVWHNRLEDPDYSNSRKLPALPAAHNAPGPAAAKRVGY